MGKRYRSRSEIVHAILRLAEKGVTKTHIMYGAYISYSQLREYLDWMIEKKMLHHDKKNQIYDLTDTGLRLLRLFEDLEELTADSNMEGASEF